ncbi:MAG TPA: TM0106 family RecB-like putative nuclease [Spirochaetia bacterium]|nr:TM0106 family RecB-like putative nuclease [Spirochaetia bacterium]
MYLEGGQFRLAATDVSNHLACRHLTQLDRAVAEGRLSAPAYRDPNLAVLQQRGFLHERAYVAYLKAEGLRVAEPPEAGGRLSMERALQAMRSGADAIVQAELRDGRWIGRADVLLRVPQPGAFGPWSYEVVDTKLAEETRAGTVLQLCHYSELLATVQGVAPEWMHVVKPGPDFPRESFRYDEVSAYYRLVRRRLDHVLSEPPTPSTYPYPVPHCEICRWWKACDERRHADDNLCLVAGIQRLQTAELERQGIGTVEQFAREPKATREKPRRGSPESFVRIHGQARVQLEGREAGKPRYRILRPEPGLGFYQLPAPDAGDVFFDIEADPFAGDGGMEYLLGFAFLRDGGMEYQGLWALDRVAERTALERFMDFIRERWQTNPGMHIYHYSPYEPAAVKRLAGRHGTREAELDRLLRAERFVDLLAVTRRAVQASVESYSLKALEPFDRFARSVELPQAAAALRRIARSLELTGPADITAADRAATEAYNRDDCLSTAALRDWLERLRKGLEVLVPRPESPSGDAPEAVEERAAEVEEVYHQLVDALPEDRSAWGSEARARWLLAHQLEYFRREDKSAWWEFFRINELDPEELLDERKAVAGLRFVGPIGRAGKMPIHRYEFPDQEVAMDEGDELYEVGGETIGKVHAIDLSRHTLDIVKKGRTIQTHPSAVMVDEHVRPAPVDGSFLQLARSVAEKGVDGSGPYRAARDLLLADPPRLRRSGGQRAEPEAGSSTPGPLRAPGERVVEAAVRLVKALDGGVLPIQGPPGSGKTYTGARMIVALARDGKRIGVTAVSHKVIQNLLAEVRRAAAQEGGDIRLMHKEGRSQTSETEGIELAPDNETARAGLLAGKVVGGTAWLWSRDDMEGLADYLFIDEAGQMSLAHALATARSARNLVLLGDPQQLEQPQRGAHPEGADVSALVHVLGGRKTIPDEAGLFLDETWRLHPGICRFTSEVFYERRLQTRPGLERQGLTGDTPVSGAGLFYVPVEHAGNQNRSMEEVDAIDRLVSSLLGGGVRWTNARGEERPLCDADILVVAPYNAQVTSLINRLPRGVRVGTVDRFQGQEAPVVIYSMTSSSAQDAPRGMSFLFSPNRLNVATSRARCVCILVAAPGLLEPECSSPEQMIWANALCRYRELATEVAVL